MHAFFVANEFDQGKCKYLGKLDAYKIYLYEKLKRTH